MTRKLRRAGAGWRVLVHEMIPRGGSGDSYHVASDRTLGGGSGEDYSIEADGRTFWSRHIELPNTDFDELVIGRWIHLEQMDVGYWWMNVGGVTVHVRADRDGRPTSVMVRGPLDFEGEARPGVSYECVWTDVPKGGKP
jgi:hypothetical protein